MGVVLSVASRELCPRPPADRHYVEASILACPQGRRGIRSQAAFHSSLVMWVSRSQEAKHSCERLGKATAELSVGVDEVVTVAEGHGGIACIAGVGAATTGEGVGAGAAWASVACTAWVPKADIRVAGGALGPPANCSVSVFCDPGDPLCSAPTVTGDGARTWSCDRPRSASKATADNRPSDAKSMTKYQTPGDLSMRHRACKLNARPQTTKPTQNRPIITSAASHLSMTRAQLSPELSQSHLRRSPRVSILRGVRARWSVNSPQAWCPAHSLPKHCHSSCFGTTSCIRRR